MARRIKVKGIRREEVNMEELALVYWLLARQAVADKRRRDAEEERKRRGGAR